MLMLLLKILFLIISLELHPLDVIHDQIFVVTKFFCIPFTLKVLKPCPLPTILNVWRLISYLSVYRLYSLIRMKLFLVCRQA